MQFIVSLLLLSTLLSACSAGVSEHIRKHTYPPNFKYISHEQILSSMWRLAQQLGSLDQVLKETDQPGETQAQAVTVILSKMEAEVASLGKEGWPSNHQKVPKHITHFRRDLAAARRALSVQPPSFYLASTISSACLHCHENR